MAGRQREISFVCILHINAQVCVCKSGLKHLIIAQILEIPRLRAKGKQCAQKERKREDKSLSIYGLDRISVCLFFSLNIHCIKSAEREPKMQQDEQQNEEKNMRLKTPLEKRVL